jgi:uncharacterized damage-inducible protein DinB
MKKKITKAPQDLKRALLEAYAVSEEMNQHLLKHLDERAWRAVAHGEKVRNIAQLVAHIHNARHSWMLTCGVDVPGLKIPPLLNRAKCTRKQAMAGLAKSARAMSHLIAVALARPDGRVKNFPSGATGFSSYHLAHEAHHRGQVMMLARQAGYPFSGEVNYKIWAFGRRKPNGRPVKKDVPVSAHR